jgi:hypothetical protein
MLLCLSDHNVPNALMFIGEDHILLIHCCLTFRTDKYTQIYRILLPICNTLSQIPKLMEKPALAKYVESEFVDTENVYREILGDFFRHGFVFRARVKDGISYVLDYSFDGSGADNFFDAGSCIDGRLTSAWNWCSSIEKKRYWPVFLLVRVVYNYKLYVDHTFRPDSLHLTGNGNNTLDIICLGN